MQIQFNTGVCTLLLVKVPAGTTMLEVDKVDNILMCWPDSSDMADYFELPDGNWQFIGLSHELTEEQCVQLAKKMADRNFKNYEDKFGNAFSSAKESFASLCRHLKVYNVNPVDNDQNILNMYSEWLEAQERTGTWAVLRLEE